MGRGEGRISFQTRPRLLIRALVADTLQEVRNLRKDLNSITDRAAPQNNTSMFTKFQLEFPLKTIEKLKKFDVIMQNETKFKDAVSIIPSLVISVFYM